MRNNGYPMRLEKWYQRYLIKLVNKMDKATKSFFKKRPLGNANLRLDDNNGIRGIQQELDLYALVLQNIIFRKRDASDMAQRFVFSLTNFSSTKLENTISVGIRMAPIGVDPLKGDEVLTNYVQGKIAENTSLIKNLEERYVSGIKEDIYHNLTSGDGSAALTKTISKRTDMTKNRAKLIATDQTGTIVSQIDAYRAKKAGAKKYIWHSAEDNRVRPKHQHLNKKIFEYGDPNGGDGGQLPGEPIRCRCFAEPIFERKRRY